MASNPIGGVGNPPTPPPGKVGPQPPPPQPTSAPPKELIAENEAGWERTNAANHDADDYFKALEWVCKQAYGEGWQDAMKQVIEKVRAK